jgi:hypothetical protein
VALEITVNMPERIQAKDIEQTLRRLILDAIQIAPFLADRLQEIWRWIKDKKPGQLMSKPHVMYFLDELFKDVRFWLDLNMLELEARRVHEAEMTPTERYWYTELFPRWFKEPDPKLSIWQRKLMAGEFSQKDKALIDDLCRRVDKQGGSSWDAYILDLSMATDLIVSADQEKPLCIQLTTLSSQLSEAKKEGWEFTLQYWQIQRGLFANFNPMRDRAELESRLRLESDRLPDIGYNKIQV